MTVSSTTNKESYNGNGSQSVFAYGFKIFADADIKVYVGTTLKTISTHYTLSGVGVTSGGNVTFTAGNIPAVGTGNVTLLRNLALTQAVDLINYGKFDPEVIEAQYDKLVMMVQQLQEQTDRTIRFSTTVSDAGGVEITDTVAERSGKVLAYDANGDLSVANELGDWQGYWATTAGYAVRDLVLDASTNNVYTCLVGHTSGTLATDVTASKWALVINAAAVATSATNAANSASAASTGAGTATTQAGIATTKASEASSSASTASTGATTATTKASEASTSASNAATSAASAATALDSFDDRYLGSQSSEPGVDNDGNALAEGALYFDSSSNGMKVYDGASWIAASSAGTASMLTYKYVATSAQTTFTGADANSLSLTYTVANIVVFLNGVALDSTDYTATSGTSIVLATGATTGSELVVIAFKSFTVADHYTQAQADAAFANKGVAQTFTAAQTFGPNSGMTGTTPPDDASNYNISIEQSGANVTGDYDAGLAFVANQGGSVKAGVLSYDDGGSGKTGLAFVVNDGSLLEVLNIDSDGIVTKPYHPGFKVGWTTASATGSNRYLSTNNNDSVVAGRDSFNSGNHFNPATGSFTAPVAGMYMFGFQGMRNGGNGSSLECRINKNGSTMFARAYLSSFSSSHEYWSLVTNTKCAAGDYFQVLIGANTSIYNEDTYFYGHLIG